VLTINGQKLWHYAGVSDYLKEHKGEPVTLAGLRDGKPFEVAVTPVVPLNSTNNDPKIGLVWLHGGRMALTHPGAIEQVRGSVNSMISTFAALFSPKSDIKPQHLGGAVKILSVYYILFDSDQGWRLALWFSVLMNVNLAILNLLPFPVLDGGHIFLALLESIRRKPVNVKVLNYIQTSCAVALIAFMLYIAFFDVQELSWWKKDKEQPVHLQFPKEQPK
jgi:regulator of sigma E protease